jgi:hypothetical protein
MSRGLQHLHNIACVGFLFNVASYFQPRMRRLPNPLTARLGLISQLRVQVLKSYTLPFIGNSNHRQ